MKIKKDWSADGWSQPWSSKPGMFDYKNGLAWNTRGWFSFGQIAEWDGMAYLITDIELLTG